jgi:hypothetical protein
MLLLTDYRSGALGRISLETPDTRRDRSNDIATGLGEVQDHEA